MTVAARLRAIVVRAHAAFRRQATIDALDDDVRTELEIHLEMHAAENIRRGMSPDAAWRDARLAAGGVAQAMELARDQRSLPWLATAVAELRQAARGRLLVQHPVFSAAVILSLAIGISLTAGVFAIVESAHFARMPFANGERIEHLALSYRAHPDDRNFVVPTGVYAALARAGGPIEGAAAYQFLSERVRHQDRYGDAWVARTTAGFPALLGMRAMLGRLYDERDADAPVIVLSRNYWQSEFGGDSAIVGTTLQIGTRQLTIVGVADPMTTFPDRIHFWESGFRGDSAVAMNVGVLALLRDGTTHEEGRARISAIGGAALRDLNKRSDARITSIPLRDFLMQGVLGPILFVLSIIATFIALIAAVNFAVLMLARGLRRRSELGVRAALGASVPQLARHIVGECLLLCALGGALGALLAFATLGPLRALISDSLPTWLTIGIGWRTVAASIGASIVIGLLFGCGAALDIARPALVNFLRGASGTASDAGRLGRTRSRLVALQVGLAATALIVLGALIGRAVLETEPHVGFDYSRIVRATVLDTVNFRRPQPPERMERVLSEARQTAGVAAAGFRRLQYAKTELIAGESATGSTTADDAGISWFWIYRVGDGFFAVIRPRVLEGRLPTDEEIRRGDPLVVITRRAARSMFGGRAVGGRLRGVSATPLTVVGVVDEVRENPGDLRSAAAAFVPMQLANDGGLGSGGGRELWVRASGAVGPTVRTLRSRLTPPQLDGVRVDDLMPESTRVWREFQAYHRIALLFVGIFTVALLLAAVGIYGLVAYTAEMKSRELAIREALGATRLHIAGRVMSVALVQSLIGVTLGALLSTLVIEHLNGYHMKLTPVAGSTVVAMALVGLTVLVASIGPVVRAWTRELTLELRA